MDKKTEEEFNNFMMKVTDINNIVRKMNSDDKNMQLIADLEAKKYLGETDVEKNIQDIDDVDIRIKCDRTVLNKKALHKKESNDGGKTQSQEAFMQEVERDADKRYKDKLVRMEKMETIKKQAGLAFRRQEYEKALSLYTKALDLIRDSIVLYNNRALTYIKLKFYEKSIPDLNWALRLNEDCLKSWLLLAKANYCLNNSQEFDRCIKEAIERNPKHKNYIHEFVDDLKKKNDEIHDN